MARPHPLLLPLAAGREPAVPPTSDNGLLASAIDHGMQGLLWTYVRDGAPRYRERARLAGADAATRQRHARLRRTLVRVCDTLASIDVAVAAVKGVAAEQRWYGREGERPCTDVDVLVDPGAIERAGEIVGVLDATHPLRNAIDSLVRSGAMQSVNLHVDGESVDLHFDLLKLGYPMRRREAVWSRMELLTLADGSCVRVPDPATALLHFLVHANKDGFPRLLGYADVARVLASRAPDAVDWDWFTELVRSEGLDPIVTGALDTITHALALPRVSTAGGHRARAAIWHVVWPERVTLLGSAGRDRSRRQEVLPFLVARRLPDALRAAARVVVPPEAAVVARYPDLPGPYAWRLLRGRARTRRDRRTALRARTVPAPPGGAPPPTADPDVVARLMRSRAGDGGLWLSVSGRSMGRSIPGGARVRIVRAPEPRRGEVWAFSDERSQIVVHRCRSSEAGAYRFQGDACVRADSPVPRERLIGRVVETAPPRSAIRWGTAAGAVQRTPRVAIARTVRVARRIRRDARR